VPRKSTQTAKKTPKQSPVASKQSPAAPKKSQNKGLKIGDRAPSFSLPGLKGNTSPASLKGKKIVLYFYPKDDTSGCTKEACAFQDNLQKFTKAGATVIGVSKDNLASHEKFAKKYKLNFNLASDEDTKTAAAFGAWVEKSMYGRKFMGMDRSTFLIDASGKIASIWRNVKVPGHVEEVLEVVKKVK
jgi:peroxiredoxin Q/BCP